jgi:hypothetical protein
MASLLKRCYRVNKALLTQIVGKQNSMIVLQKPAAKASAIFPPLLQLLFVKEF